jgi:5-methylcytosine-specific restriction endonuclease McrA
MKFTLNGRVRRHTDEQLLADLRKTAKKTGRNTISNKRYRHLGAYCPGIITRRFGSWNNALQKAGLTLTRQYNVSIARLFANLYTLWLTLGRQPRLTDLHPPHSLFSRRPYLRTFGKWSIALQKFVKHTNTHNTRSKTKTIPPPAPTETENEPTTHTTHPRTITWRLRHLIMKRDNFRCKNCGASPASNPTIILHIDHIIPTSKGGLSQPQNLQTLCSICNIGKSNL